jgi:hypothetical protein
MINSTVPRCINDLFSGKKMKDTGYDNITGKPLYKAFLEVNLPRYLRKDIDALIKGEQEHSNLLDCL